MGAQRQAGAEGDGAKARRVGAPVGRLQPVVVALRLSTGEPGFKSFIEF